MKPLHSCALLACLVACGSSGGDTGSATDATTDASTDDAAFDAVRADTTGDVTVEPDTAIDDSTAPADALAESGVSDVGPSDVGSDAPAPTCATKTLGAKLGRTDLLIGGQMADATFAASPFDLRYVYIAGDAPATPCAKCDASCSKLSTWWGCWGNSGVEGPGAYVGDHVTTTRAHGNAVPMISWYRWYTVAGSVENAPEIAKMNQGPLVAAYMADFQFFMRVIGKKTPAPVIVHLEPDLWAFAEQVNKDPAKIPAAVSASGIAACSGLGDTVAGFAKCMLAIARAEAPNAIVAFHASSWADGPDVLVNTSATYDVKAHADRSVAFLQALGATNGDVLVVEMSNHDAGSDGNFWDATDAKLPDFAQALTWVGELGKASKLPTLWWQIPYGNMSLPNTCGKYQDNRVQYVFDHPERFAAAGSLGVAFGQALDCMTNDTTDGGYFASRAAGYFAGSRPTLACPP